MLVGKRKGGTSWKIGEKIMEEVEEFKDFGVWFNRKLCGNVHLEKMANKAEEWVGNVIWMSRVSGQVEVVRGRMVCKLIGRPSVEHAAGVWWSGVVHPIIGYFLLPSLVSHSKKIAIRLQKD